MEKTEKTKYVKQWESHIKSINTIGMCSDEKLSKKIFSLVDELISLIPKVADDKIKHTLIRKVSR